MPLEPDPLMLATSGEDHGRCRFLDFVALWNESQGLTTPDLHRQIGEWLDRGAGTSDARMLLMVFRNAGKSTLVGLYAAWRLLRMPDVRIMVLSADHTLACKMTRNIRRIIERHAWMQELRPKRKEQWAADQFTIERSMSLRDPSLLARGISSNITGSRADLIICDDVEVPNTADTPLKREDLRERLGEIPFILVPGGTQLYVGTPHSYDSIYAEDAVEATADQKLPFLPGFDRLILPVYDEEGDSRWPERFSTEHIEAVLARSGPAAFQSQMMLRPNAGHKIRLDPKQLCFYDAPLEVSHANRVDLLFIDRKRMVSSTCFWDPAFGRELKADSSVVAVVFLDEDGHYWLHGMDYLRVNADPSGPDDVATQQCRAVARFAKAMRQPRIVIETNGLGQFLPSTLQRVIREECLDVAVLGRATTGRKADRILNVFDPVLAARRLHVHKSVWETPFVREMREWTPMGHGRDDGLDAVSSCIINEPARAPRMPARPRSLAARETWRGSGQIFAAQTDFPV